jgi:hypothetical protein
MQKATKNSILQMLIEIVAEKKLSVEIEYKDGVYIIREKNVVPVMVSHDKIEWRLRYHKSGNECYPLPYDILCRYDYIIPFERFNPCNIQESLKFNLSTLNDEREDRDKEG